jgi:AbrB family looped-hinge helix DNA binding protein
MNKQLTSGADMIMKEIISTITSKGQVTIPAEVRKHLGLKTKDKVVFLVEEEGAVRLLPPRYPDLGSLRGAAGSLKKPLSWQEVRQIAREDHLKDKYQDKL